MIKFNFSNLTKEYVLGKLITNQNIEAKSSKSKMIDCFFDPNKLLNMKQQKYLIEHIETNLGTLIENILKEHLIGYYTVIENTYYGNGNDTIDFPLKDNLNNIILLELKTARSTYNSSSKKAVKNKLFGASQTLNNTMGIFNINMYSGYIEDNAKSNDFDLCSKDTAKLLTGEETFFDQLTEHFKLLNINLIGD